MHNSLKLALAMAAVTLGTVPAAHAQMNQQMGDHRPDQDRRGDQDHRGDQDRRGDRPGRGPGPGMVSRDQSLRLRSTIGDLNNQVTRAHQDRRLSQGQFLGFQRQIRSLQNQYWGKMDGGMSRGEYGSVNTAIARLRTQLDRTVAQNGRHSH